MESELAVDTIKKAYMLVLEVVGPANLQTCKTMLNWASLLAYFKMYQEAIDLYEKLQTTITSDEKMAQNNKF